MLGATSRAFGEPMPYSYGGEELLVCGRFVGVYPRLEAEYYRRHPGPLKHYRDAVDAGWFPDEAERDKLLRLCVEATRDEPGATGRAILDWIGTIDGDAFYGSLLLKRRPADGRSADDAPFLTEAEVKSLIVAEMEATLARWSDRTEQAEKLAAEAEHMSILKLMEAINAASGTDLLGKGTGQSGSGTGGEASP